MKQLDVEMGQSMEMGTIHAGDFLVSGAEVTRHFIAVILSFHYTLFFLHLVNVLFFRLVIPTIDIHKFTETFPVSALSK